MPTFTLSDDSRGKSWFFKRFCKATDRIYIDNAELRRLYPTFNGVEITNIEIDGVLHDGYFLNLKAQADKKP